jgi:hypothetical protein
LGLHRGVAEQVVVVCGATGAVGRATVLAALDRNARVVAVGHHTRDLAALTEEADAPHRFDTVLVDASGRDAAERAAFVTTSRFGLLHTWVQVIGRAGVDARRVHEAAGTVFRQLRRSGGGTFVVVAPESTAMGAPRRRELADLDLEVARLDAARHGRRDLASVTVVRRSGIVPPDRVAHEILRAAVRRRPEWVVRGSARRDAIVARVTPGPALGRHRPQGAWILR